MANKAVGTTRTAGGHAGAASFVVLISTANDTCSRQGRPARAGGVASRAAFNGVTFAGGSTEGEKAVEQPACYLRRAKGAPEVARAQARA
ncbi:hypothetical protein [Burkholderia metallica]|uniref:hypothetical protein n=1 Tax=Burkholderia metallica TaxID=488729 RepID=UPI001575B3A9|nr:hypothetical protein [Burkholderia metallica]NTZ09915.1 hypothetical protein [Burkholderia metallica]